MDITPTGCTSYSPEKELERNQQRNWETILQIISLRTQPTIISTTAIEDNLKNFQFGVNYTGVHKIWTFEFAVEYSDIYRENSDNYGLLKYDFKITPVIIGLTETAKPAMSLFYVSGPWNNIYFKSVA